MRESALLQVVNWCVTPRERVAWGGYCYPLNILVLLQCVLVWPIRQTERTSIVQRTGGMNGSSFLKKKERGEKTIRECFPVLHNSLQILKKKAMQCLLILVINASVSCVLDMWLWWRTQLLLTILNKHHKNRGYMFTLILQFSCTTSSCRTQDKLDVINCLIRHHNTALLRKTRRFTAITFPRFYFSVISSVTVFLQQP